jgi:ABC-type antimicrobial peptide transport system permease subunit
MKASMYTTYPVRSLLRGGQRTLLAVFCIAVGVMAIVGLQLVGAMIEDALIGNTRVLNGGDVSVHSSTLTALQPKDIAQFDALKEKGQISAYTAAYEDQAQTVRPNGKRAHLLIRVIDPAVFPLVGTAPLAQTTGGDFRTVLAKPGTAVVTARLFEELGGELGKTITINAGNDNRQVKVTIVGVLEKGSPYAKGSTVFVSTATYGAASELKFAFNTIYVTTPTDGSPAQVKAAVKERLPLARIMTAAELLQQLEDGTVMLKRFLMVIGLLALLIGGVGIVNTMQVLLARRKTEIAMLKTAGYLRRDLYLLFGIEAALLGLVGGVVGAAAGIGIAAGIRSLFERAFQLTLTFQYDVGIILGGIAVGLATALIFGIMPIVKAARIRPLAVLRDLPEEWSFLNMLITAGLVVLLSVLFTVLATFILGNVWWAIGVVYGTFFLLAMLSAGFRLLVFLIGYLPVPERYSILFLLLVTVGVVLAGLTMLVPNLRGVGALLLLGALGGYVVVLLPRAWKISTKMALRNIGRGQGRTTTTLLALFIGVFVVGFVVVIGQGIRDTITNLVATQLRYNFLALVPVQDTDRVNRTLDGLDGIKQRQVQELALGTQPVEINGQPIGPRLGHGEEFDHDRISAKVALIYLSGMQAYDLAGGQVPTKDRDYAVITEGRALTAADADTNNIMLDDDLRKLPLQLKVGDQITMVNQFTGKRETLTVVGFYKSSLTGVRVNLNPSAVFGSRTATRNLGGPTTMAVFSLQVETDKTTAVNEALTREVPRAFVFDIGDAMEEFGRVFNNILLMLTAIASLVLFAGIVIIANAVALAMLERRRELGIMKATGYTSGRVLSVVLIENGVIGAVGSLLGMMLVSLATALFGLVGNVDFGVNPVTTVGLIGLVAAVAMATATVVAWRSTRVRPLEVLRYE